MTTTILLIVIGIVVVIALLFGIGMYNKLQRKRIDARNAWSDIDVQLKRRYDLVPNLVNTVKGYAEHERETLEAVIQARQQAIDAKDMQEQAGAENMLTNALGRLFALSEAYPDLKANQNFLNLQEELTSTENKISFARQHYNRTVNQYDEALQTFPSNVVAGIFGMKPMEYFEIEDHSQREAPKVEF